MKRMIAALAVVLVASGVYAGDFPEISVAEVKDAIQAKKITLIDVNGSESWKGGHIPGAIDFQSSKGKLASLLPQEKDALVVAYCGGPSCGAYAAAAKAAKALGYTNVKHLKAGLSGWQGAGETMQKCGCQ
ncbi:MAG: rhodanese-like domain-containing protein [Verrucomicrobia bacterium]|nr:rhodanese-like domain-containing protein [Verrucomicrobiota bacterium]